MEKTGPSRFRDLGSLIQNWISLTGVVVMIASFFAFILLFVLNVFAPAGNPYVGVLTYLVAPGFTVMGIGLTLIGAWRRRRQLRRSPTGLAPVVIDLSRPRDRKVMLGFLTGSIGFLMLTAFGSYQTYHITESTAFCGQLCHTVMEPEWVTYQNGPHARVACVECHIGAGATWFVRSKLSGTYQVYATLADKYPRPVPTPIKNLRPAPETCEQCHWPQQFVGDVQKTYTYYLAEQTNPVHSIRMLLKVGGADPRRGPVGGIHWHMNVANKVEYYPADESRQKIPWVRVTDGKGSVTEYRSPGFTNTVDEAKVRAMDCVDCHNRPSHQYHTPSSAVNTALALGTMDASLPWIKTNAVYLLTQEYATKAEATATIAKTLEEKYPGQPRLKDTIAAVQRIYHENFFPEMKASWRAYPDNIGHKDWPGCFRCHDEKHKTADGSKVLKSSDCHTCHVILAQGVGDELNQLDARGQEFKHPGDELDPGSLCHDCHTGE